jgi:hypothetical protein
VFFIKSQFKGHQGTPAHFAPQKFRLRHNGTKLPETIAFAKCPTEPSNHSAWHVSWVKPRLLVYSTSGCAFACASTGSVAAGAAAVAAVAAAGGELERPEPSADWT